MLFRSTWLKNHFHASALLLFRFLCGHTTRKHSLSLATVSPVRAQFVAASLAFMGTASAQNSKTAPNVLFLLANDRG